MRELFGGGPRSTAAPLTAIGAPVSYSIGLWAPRAVVVFVDHMSLVFRDLPILRDTIFVFKYTTNMRQSRNTQFSHTILFRAGEI